MKPLIQTRDILVTGGTGYIGRRLIAKLLERGHRVRALVRSGAALRLPSGAESVVGNALDAESIAAAARAGDTLVQLVGTPHPNPSKAREFERVDLASALAAVSAAKRTGVSHFVYVSVAQPAPVMQAYVAARAKGEKAIAEANLAATILRPWYVLGPGHRWPLALIPVYAIASWVPAWREGAERLGLVTHEEMVRALVRAVEDPPAPSTRRVMEVPAIRAARSLDT